jgi:hypothetical protein
MNDQLRIKMNNSSASQGSGRCEWSVWIDGDQEQLNQIDRVEYVLHPTLPQPLRTVRDRSTNFKLESRGWGEFMVHAKAITKEGETLRLNHWLKLSDRGGAAESTSVSTERAPVFVAYNRADSPLAVELSRVLEERGIKVLTENQFSTDEPMDRAIRVSIGRADAVLALIAAEPGRWVLAEIFEAQWQQVPIFAILLGENTTLPESLPEEMVFRLENPTDMQKARAILGQELARLNL